MTDRYENIRKALAMGPTPGPWNLMDGRTDTVENAQGYPVCTVNWHPNERYDHGTRAAYIAACDPDTIRALLEERDALRAEVERLHADLMESDEIREKLGHLLTRTTAALKGEPPEGVWHSWHDLPEKATQLAEALKKVAQSLEWYAHGRCRGFDDEAPLPTNEAVELAERTLAKVHA